MASLPSTTFHRHACSDNDFSVIVNAFALPGTEPLHRADYCVFTERMTGNVAYRGNC